jgi:alkylhydroperoxidase/carboxymuconolactone decarboxylase family protein YurZ
MPSFFFAMMRPRTTIKSTDLPIHTWYRVRISVLFAVRKRDAATKIMQRVVRVDRSQERVFEELFLHLSLLLGFPAMLDGLSRLRSIVPNRSRRNPPPVNSRRLKKRGMMVLKQVYGGTLGRLLSNLESLQAEVPDFIIRDVYGRIIARRGLTLRDREVVNVAVLTVQGLDQQLYSHIRGALRLGVSVRSVKRVVAFAARSAGISAKGPLRILSDVATSKRSISQTRSRVPTV